jgi:hypothetical protein
MLPGRSSAVALERVATGQAAWMAVDIVIASTSVRTYALGDLALRHPNLGLAESIDHIAHPSIDRKVVRM